MVAVSYGRPKTIDHNTGRRREKKDHKRQQRANPRNVERRILVQNHIRIVLLEDPERVLEAQSAE